MVLQTTHCSLKTGLCRAGQTAQDERVQHSAGAVSSAPDSTFLQFCSVVVWLDGAEEGSECCSDFVNTLCIFDINLMISCVQALLIDFFPDDSVSSTAIVNICRCSLYAAGLAVVDKMIWSLGAGWAFNFVGGIFLVGHVLVMVEYKYGREIEKRRRRIEEMKK